jgi:hypothetical protein
MTRNDVSESERLQRHLTVPTNPTRPLTTRLTLAKPDTRGAKIRLRLVSVTVAAAPNRRHFSFLNVIKRRPVTELWSQKPPSAESTPPKRVRRISTASTPSICFESFLSQRHVRATQRD